MDLRRLRFAVSQIEVKASRHLPEPRGMLITVQDLPPGWKVLDERRWRTGAALEAFWSSRLKSLAAHVSVTATRDGPDMTLSGGTVKTVEQLTTGPVGPGASRHVVRTHGSVVSALAGSAFGEPWHWQSLEEIVSQQNRRIDAVVNQ